MHTVITVDDLNHEIQQLHEKTRDLALEIEVLVRLRERALNRHRTAQAKPKAPRSNGQAGMSIAESVRQFVQQHPFKHTQSEIARILKDQINTTAANPERSLYSTLWTLRDSGFLKLDQTKRVGPAPTKATEADDDDLLVIG